MNRCHFLFSQHESPLNHLPAPHFPGFGPGVFFIHSLRGRRLHDAARDAQRRPDGGQDGDQRLDDELPDALLVHDFRVLSLKKCGSFSRGGGD